MRLSSEYLNTVGEMNNLTPEQIQALHDIFNTPMYYGFSRECESDANKLQKLEDKAKRLQNELMETMESLGLPVNHHELFNLLKTTSLKSSRVSEVERSWFEDYKNQLIEADFAPTEINKYYLPAIKRYFKSQNNNPFNISF